LIRRAIGNNFTNTTTIGIFPTVGCCCYSKRCDS
jgi:hypothetical protein